MNRYYLLALIGTASLLAAPGCHHCGCRQSAPAPVVSAPCPCPAPGALPPTRLVPQPPGIQAPAAPVPIAPGPVSPGVPVAPAPGVSRYGPVTAAPVEPSWRPAPGDAGVRLNVPPAQTPEPPREAARVAAPEPMPQTPAPQPGVSEQPSASPPLPVGIPQFAVARDQVASGLKPLLDGLDWLHAHGYRTVLHLRAPGEDDSADRKQVEKRGLRFLSLEVSPQTLTQAVVDEFNRVVSDPANRPLFVYDRDGTPAGGLWYLYFRTIERNPDEEARTKAARLGLRDDPSGDQRAMWLAIQKLLPDPGR